MSEAVSKKNAKSKANNAVKVEKGPIEIVLEGFTAEETARLLQVKQAVAEGRYTDVTNEHRKLLFIQWLVDHGKLSS